MKQNAESQKTPSRNAHEVAQAATAGAEGASVAPPAYGIDFLDRGQTEGEPIQRQADGGANAAAAAQAQPVNRTGLPDRLKAGVEALSGIPMNNVRVHYNSAKPAQLNAYAYAQGTDIHVGPGQERHLPHEAWHLVQQAQGRVKPTVMMKAGVAVNDNAGLESEADVMGARAVAAGTASAHVAQRAEMQIQMNSRAATGNFTGIVQRMAITRRMHNLVLESASLDELMAAIANFSLEYQNELIQRWNKNHEDESMDGTEEEPNITDDEGDLESAELATSVSEYALNSSGHGGDVLDSDIGGDSYNHNADIDLNTIQLARTPGTMTGPKDYNHANGHAAKNVFYILDSMNGSIDFSEAPTKPRYNAYVPGGKQKKAPLKASSGISWANPNMPNSLVDLNKHPNKAYIDKKDRPQHFGMADALYAKAQGWKSASQTAKMRLGKWTWHHLPNKYEMILVDMYAHAQHGHNGGVHIW